VAAAPQPPPQKLHQIDCKNVTGPGTKSRSWSGNNLKSNSVTLIFIKNIVFSLLKNNKKITLLVRGARFIST